MVLTSNRRLREPAALARGWELSRLAGACYEAALARLYGHFRGTGKMLLASDLLKGMAKDNVPEFRAMSAQLAQAAAVHAANDYINAVRARAAYSRDKSGFTGRPRMPRLGRKYGMLRISNQQFRIVDGQVRFNPGVGLPAMPRPANIPSTSEVMAILLRPEGRSLHLDFAYETEPASLKERREREKKRLKETNLRQKDDSRGQRLIVDLNVNGVAILDDTPAGKLSGMVINLRPLKSRIALANNILADIQSEGHDHAKRVLNAHRGKLNRYTQHFLHCVANDVIHHAVACGAKYVLVGRNKGWKQEAKLGRRGNRRFVSMPLGTLIKLLGYKCRMQGLWLQETEEAYTSKVDHLALEPMQRPKDGRFLGQRVKRGLFRSSTGRMIHADINGCIGIGRKVSGDRWIAEAIQPLARNGARLAPSGTVVASGLAAMPRRIEAISEINLAA